MSDGVERQGHSSGPSPRSVVFSEVTLTAACYQRKPRGSLFRSRNFWGTTGGFTGQGEGKADGSEQALG